MRRAGPAAALVLVVLLVAGGCTSPAERRPLEDPRRPVITVTSFDFPESETLAELYGQAMRQQGYPVAVVARLGPREIVQPALEQGRVDLVLGYLGSALNFMYDKRVATADPQATYARLTLGEGRAPHRGFHQQAPGVQRRAIATRRGSAASVACTNRAGTGGQACVEPG